MKYLMPILPIALLPLQVQAVDAQAVFNAAIDEVQAKQSENPGPVITAVLEASGGDEQACWRMLTKAAEAGHPVALIWQARQALLKLHMQRLHPESSPEAVALRAAVEKAAACGYMPAVVELAHLCGSGIGAPADEDKGMTHLMQACKENSMRARAAYLMLSGRLEKEGAASPAVAAELKRKNYHVEELLSALLAQTDEEKSKEWLAQAALHGSPGAAGTLAIYHLQQGDDVQGYQYLKQAAERDHPESLAQLAAFTLPGAELPESLRPHIAQNADSAIRLFQRAALLGHTPALLPLAGEYHKHPEKYSPERVFNLYRLAAEAGDLRGRVAHAYCLATGRGCPADAGKGVQILKQLVDAGVSFANLALADLYFNASGVPADMTRALGALTSAAADGVPQCYTLMAVLAQLGNESKASDPTRAKVYLRMARERGELNPQTAFDEMVNRGSWKFIP